MVLGRSGFTWVEDSLSPGLAEFGVRCEAAVQTIVAQVAADSQDYMQENAPWEDRTKQAREGLEAEPFFGTISGIVLAHGVDYGIWLEIRFGGELAIIIPTLEVMGPRLMKALEETFNLVEQTR